MYDILHMNFVAVSLCLLLLFFRAPCLTKHPILQSASKVKELLSGGLRHLHLSYAHILKDNGWIEWDSLSLYLLFCLFVHLLIWAMWVLLIFRLFRAINSLAFVWCATYSPLLFVCVTDASHGNFQSKPYRNLGIIYFKSFIYFYWYNYWYQLKKIIIILIK